MTGLDVLPVQALMSASSELVASYGLKTAGHAQLLSLQGRSPIAYDVPPAWAVPASSQGRATRSDLRDAFENLTKGLSRETVLMARGSALSERPGESPTLFFLFDPQDRRASFKVFESRIGEVRAAHQDMGVLATLMVGGLSVFRDGRRGIGWNNVSFVADTHHPMAPRDMHIAAVSGLGTQAVAAGREAVFITADRMNGLINSFVNKTQEAFLRPYFGSKPCFDRKAYRQKKADYFDLENQRLEERALESEFFEWFRFDPVTGTHRVDIPRVIYGHLVRNAREVSLDKKRELHSIPGFRPEEVDVGVNPFREGAPLMNLIGILQFLSGEAGPVQIEGAFSAGSSPIPFLYQLQEMPESAVSRIPLGVTSRDLHSTEVIGVVDFTGPLLWTREATATVLREMDRRFAASGYILVTSGHEGKLIEATPHCRIRLATDQLNIGSHAVALARLKMWENPDAGYLLAQNVAIANARRDSIGGRQYDDESDGVSIFHRAHLQSNGSEMAVEV